jgi:phosphate transport system protein
MTQLETEIKELKTEVINMWELVRSQLNKANNAITLFDKDLAREVIKREKRVNAYELAIDRNCENIFALYTPVAVDLRFVLAVLKINNNLERIGDIAEGISRYVIDSDVPFNEINFKRTELNRMYEDSVKILDDTLAAFREEDTALARTIFKKDEVLNEINLKANQTIAELIKEDINFAQEAMFILSIIRKLERVGDQCTNIAEEIIFYVEAKVLKHVKDENR